ncbi:MAG TPA: LysR substrate-binding domain-containing protein [Terriglobales bacterium]|nr:LysR substrate-binding domain-containing protein [Terriglobales bacterium]
MDLFQLEVFVAVAREGSFSRAAEKLFRTQPAVSQAIRKLENELGEPLFDRSSRDGNLTDAGHVLHEYAHKLLNLRTEASAALLDLRDVRSGRLSLAANEYTTLYLLPVLAEFRRLYPMVKATVQRSFASRIPRGIIEHTVELGVTSFNPEDPLLRSIVVYRDELALVVYPRHPLASAKQVSIRDLGVESFVAHNVPSPFRLKVIEAFKRHRTTLNMDTELPTIEAIKKFVISENGVALLPALSVENEVQRGELVPVAVADLRLERKLRIVYRRNASLSHAGRAFLKIAEALAAQQKGRYMYQPER